MRMIRSSEDFIPQILKSTASYVISYAHLRARGVDSSFFVDAFSKSPSLSTEPGVSIRSGTEFGGGSIELCRDVSVGPNCVLKGDVTVGRGTNFVGSDRIVGRVDVGQFCAFAKNVAVQQRDHDMTRPSIQANFYSDFEFEELSGSDAERIAIGDDVWLGLGSTVVSGVSVGSGAVIAADALVSRDVRPYEIVGGNPASHIGWRFSEPVRETLLQISWWDWPVERIQQNSQFFNTDLSDLDPDEIRALTR